VVLSVLGNHDFHSGKERQLVQLMQEEGVRVFFGDDNLFVYNDLVGFVGVKGYWGGFNPNVISAFGEEEGKAVMRETAEDVRRLAKGLRSLNTPHKVAVMHYSPIKDTLKGESPELYGVLGAEWLARPLDEEGATVCFHGHSHRGSYNGLTRKGIPVYNVSAPVLRRAGLQLPSIHLV
jgi:Icc-related predicted phosphoesterase